MCTSNKQQSKFRKNFINHLKKITSFTEIEKYQKVSVLCDMDSGKTFYYDLIQKELYENVSIA